MNGSFLAFAVVVSDTCCASTKTRVLVGRIGVFQLAALKITCGSEFVVALQREIVVNLRKLVQRIAEDVAGVAIEDKLNESDSKEYCLWLFGNLRVEVNDSAIELPSICLAPRRARNKRGIIQEPSCSKLYHELGFSQPRDIEQTNLSLALTLRHHTPSVKLIGISAIHLPYPVAQRGKAPPSTELLARN